MLEFFAALLDSLEIYADRLKRIRQRRSLFIFQAACFVHVERPGAGRGAEQALAKTSALFIGPIYEPDRDWRFAIILRADTAQNFHTRQHVKATIEPTTVGN